MKSIEKAFDTLLDEAAKKADEKLGNMLEDYEDEAEIEYSKEHKAKMEKLFKEARKKEKTINYASFARRAAIIIVAVGLISGCVAIGTVEAWRVKFLNFVFEIGQPNTDYRFSDDEGESYSDDELILNYMPMGYEMTQSNQTSRNLFLQFSNGDSYFRCTIKDLKVNSEIDRENATVEEVKIGDLQGEIVSTPMITTVLWKDDKHAYSVSGNIEKDELVKIAENMIILK